MQKRGGVFRQPRFRPPCVWVLIYGSRSTQRGQKVVHTTYEEVKTALEVDALRMRAQRAEVAKALALAATAKTTAKKARR